MSKKERTYDQATEEFEVAKAKLAESKENLKVFRAENKIKKDKPVEDPKIAKGLEKAEAAVEKARESYDALRAELKELKPNKTRNLKYEYPEGMVDEKERKRFRAKMRKDAKKAESGDEVKPTKKAKAEKSADAEVADKPSKKAGKKASKED